MPLPRPLSAPAGSRPCSAIAERPPHGWGSIPFRPSICWSFSPSCGPRASARRRRAGSPRRSTWAIPIAWRRRPSPWAGWPTACWRSWRPGREVTARPCPSPGPWRRPVGPGGRPFCRRSASARPRPRRAAPPVTRSGKGFRSGPNMHRSLLPAAKRSTRKRPAGGWPSCWGRMPRRGPSRPTMPVRSRRPSHRATGRRIRISSWRKPGPASARRSAISHPLASGPRRTAVPFGCPPTPAICSSRSTASWTASFLCAPRSSGRSWSGRGGKTIFAC